MPADAGSPVQVDHLEPAEVKALIERIEAEQGALHILVNDIWGATRMEWNKTVWESDLGYGLGTLRLAIDTHAITSHFALPLMIRTPGGLVVEVTDGTDAYNTANYRVSFFYDLAKAAVNRMAFALAHELKPHGATALSLTPGWLRSEAVLDAYGVNEANWRDATKIQPHFAISESPAFVGARSPRWQPIRTSRVGTANLCRAGNFRRSTASPILTVASPMPGAMSSRSKTRASLPTSQAIAEAGDEERAS
jgi:NAD(P)-dependent dehydrogenase (short-subunit alcohol dehydrogenase family)